MIHSNELLRGVMAASLISVFFTTDISANEIGYGKVTGKFVFQGEIPKPEQLFKAGRPPLFLKKDLYDESLLVDQKSRGIKNIFIWIRKFDTQQTHPKLANSKENVAYLKFDQYRYVPHALFVRTDQTIDVSNKDVQNHNYHSFPMRNQPDSRLIVPNKFTIDDLQTTEVIPMRVKCDIHPWEQANILILDHPYAAITKADGSFEIDLVPEGEHDLRVWHERGGWIERALKVKVNANKTTVINVRELKIDNFTPQQAKPEAK